VLALKERMDGGFVRACRYCLDCAGRVVVTGMGKSGHIAGKIAATLASTGTPAFFVHPGEASHGDLGMIRPEDVVLAVSNSGETPEILTILPLMKRLGVPLIAMTGRPGSTLAKAADAHLDVAVAKEACPLNLAPTASTTATLAMGDALAVALLHSRGFTREDFAMSHPGGLLGRRLLLHVKDIMRSGDAIPKVSPALVVSEGLFEITRKGLGMTAVVDSEDRVLGIYTDGDLRRTLDARRDLTATPIGEVMTRNVKTVGEDMLAAEAVRLMETFAITALLVVDDAGRVVGAFNVHDLLQAGVV
jgi:arabinose-5-phosphate isomerase